MVGSSFRLLSLLTEKLRGGREVLWVRGRIDVEVEEGKIGCGVVTEIGNGSVSVNGNVSARVSGSWFGSEVVVFGGRQA